MNFNVVFPKRPLTKEYILEHTSQAALMEYYLGLPVKRGLYKNPLRRDIHPTASYFIGESGDVLFKDFGTGKTYTVWDVVKEKFDVTYKEALKIIANDLGLTSNSNKIKPVEHVEELKESLICKIELELKQFNNKELEWWNQYGISRDTLNKYNVFSANTVFINNNIVATSCENNPIFGYYFGKKNGIEIWKVYLPRRKKYRFLTNASKTMIQGLKQIPEFGEYLVVTKSQKDNMCFYEYGIPAISIQSEVSFLTINAYKKLSERFKHIIILFDNDYTGISSMNKYRKLFLKEGIKLNCMWIPRDSGCKDFSDYRKKMGYLNTLELLNKAKNIINNYE